jgi:crotonobetainyl-CoA:carnitine CoA-transferase CaiB-like acyl-CoA transferase
MTDRVQALSGLRVLDLSRWIAGPHCALMLGDMGADVVKVETPGGDPSRDSGPYVNGESTYFMALNRSKRGMVVDTRTPAGMEVLKRLIAEADVFVENYRPGTLAGMGLDDSVLHQLNPRLITVSVSGFGPDGPYANRGCFDSIAQAMSGLHSVTGVPGGEPMRAGYYVADYAAALHACIGTLLALVTRQHTGVGQRVDIALTESLLSMTSTLIPGFQGAGVVPERLGNGSSHTSPAGLFLTKDGHVQMSASSTAMFHSLAVAMGREELASDPRFISNKTRLENDGALKAEIQAWTSLRTSAEVVECFEQHKVPCGPILTISDIMKDPQLRHRGFFKEITHPVAGPVEFAGSPVRLSKTPLQVKRPSPTLGQHNTEVLQSWASMSDRAIADFAQRGAFGIKAEG